jgi:hypothetical protein
MYQIPKNHRPLIYFCLHEFLCANILQLSASKTPNTLIDPLIQFVVLLFLDLLPVPTGIKIEIIVFNSSPDVIIKTDKSSHEIVIKIVNRISGRPADN